MGKYKNGKQTETIDQETFIHLMEHGHFVRPLRDKSFLAFLYWFGVRKAEALELVKEDFKLKDGFLYVHAPAKKHGIERADFKIAVDKPYVGLIIRKVKHTRKTRRNPEGRIWNIASNTAWRIVKRVMPKHYPHYFRLNRTVKFLDNPKITLNEVRQWNAWKSMRTVDNYLGYSSRTIDKLSKELE